VCSPLPRRVPAPPDGEPAAARFAGCGLCVAEAVEDDAAQPAAREAGTALAGPTVVTGGRCAVADGPNRRRQG
jgi:hypothetical protein